MVVPNFQSVLYPLLKFSGDKKQHSIREAVEIMANLFNLTEEDRKLLLPSGTQPVFYNRVVWSNTYLKKAGLLESKRRGYFNITEEGLKVLEQNPPKIDVDFLMQFPGYAEFRTGGKTTHENPNPEPVTPEETLENSYQNLRNNIAQELISSVKSCSPDFFEKLVVDLLLNMGYGGSRRDAGEAIGRSGDGGIDGIIKEDRLGLDTIYIQAKRWENTVSRPEIQKFAGALQGQQAKKGVFITTSSFSEGAREYATIIDSKVVLIDGERLAQLMIDYDIGVSKIKSYDLKKIDTDYFTEE